MLTQRDKNILIHLEKYKALSITQCSRIFFNNCKFSYDRARKRLLILEQMEVLKSYKNKLTDEKIYYVDNMVSAHDLYILYFYSLLISNGCTNIEFKKEPRYLDGDIRPDAYFQFQYNNSMYFILLEVDLTHITSLSKFQTYERLFKTNELQEKCYNTFPLIVIMGISTLKYESQNFDTLSIDLQLSDFQHTILGVN